MKEDKKRNEKEEKLANKGKRKIRIKQSKGDNII